MYFILFSVKMRYYFNFTTKKLHKIYWMFHHTQKLRIDYSIWRATMKTDKSKVYFNKCQTELWEGCNFLHVDIVHKSLYFVAKKKIISLHRFPLSKKLMEVHIVLKKGAMRLLKIRSFSFWLPFQTDPFYKLFIHVIWINIVA